MAESKKIQNAKRLRYIRALERFSKSIVGYLSKSDQISIQGYEKKLQNAQKLLDRVEKVDLYKAELKELENLVEKMQQATMSDADIEDIKKTILYSANQYEKSKNFKRYKKPKYNKVEEW